MMDSETNTIILDSTGIFFVLCGSRTVFSISSHLNIEKMCQFVGKPILKTKYSIIFILPS